jgi:hypothetical protein
MRGLLFFFIARIATTIAAKTTKTAAPLIIFFPFIHHLAHLQMHSFFLKLTIAWFMNKISQDFIKLICCKIGQHHTHHNFEFNLHKDELEFIPHIRRECLPLLAC